MPWLVGRWQHPEVPLPPMDGRRGYEAGGGAAGGVDATAWPPPMDGMQPLGWAAPPMDGPGGHGAGSDAAHDGFDGYHPPDQQVFDDAYGDRSSRFLEPDDPAPFEEPGAIQTFSLSAFLGSFRDMPVERAKSMSAAAGIVQFKEELHQKKWRTSCMVICPITPAAVDDGVATQALLIYDLQARKERKKKEKGGGPTEVKPLRYCSFEQVSQGDKSLPLPKGIHAGYVVNLSSTVGVPSADEFAFYVETKKKEADDATDAQWVEAFRAVEALAEAEVLMQGHLALQGQRLKSHEWTDHHFELRGPVLSYYDDERRKLGAIHFENPNTDVTVHAEDPLLFEVLSPQALFVLRCSSEEECQAWVSAMRAVKESIARHVAGDQVDVYMNAVPTFIRNPMIVEVNKQAIGAELAPWPGCQSGEQYLHVIDVKPFGAFASQQVQPGMVVVAINGQDCGRMDEAAQMRALAARPVTLQVGFGDDGSGYSDGAGLGNEAQSPLMRAKARYGTQWESMSREEQHQALTDEVTIVEQTPPMEAGTPRSVSFWPDDNVYNDAAHPANEGESPLVRAKARYKHQWDHMSREERSWAVTEEVELTTHSQGAQRSPSDRPTTIAGYLQSRNLDVSKTLRSARPGESTSQLLLRDLDAAMQPPGLEMEEERRLRGVLTGKQHDEPGLPGHSAATLRQAERMGRPINVSVHDLQFTGEDLRMAEHTRAGTHKLSTLIGTTGMGNPYIDDDFDHEYSKAVDGYWGGTLGPVARLRAAALLTDLATMKDVLYAEERRQRLKSAVPHEYADPVEVEVATRALVEATEKLQARYREERSLRREGQSGGSLIATPDSLLSSKVTLQETTSPPPKGPRRVARTDPAVLDDYDPTAADIAARRRNREARKVKVSAHVGHASTAAEAVALGKEAGQTRGFQAGGREMDTISSLDQGHPHHKARNSGSAGQSEPSTPVTPRRTSRLRGEDQAVLLSGISAMSLQTAVEVHSPSHFSSGSSGASVGGGARWETDAGRSDLSRHRAAPSSYSRQTSPRSRTVRARRRAKAGAATTSSDTQLDGRILENLASERSGVFARMEAVEPGRTTSTARDSAVNRPITRSLDQYRSPLSAVSGDAHGGVYEKGSPRTTDEGRRSASLTLRAQHLADQRSSPLAARSPGRTRALTPGY